MRMYGGISMKKRKADKELEKLYNDLEEARGFTRHEAHDLRDFFLGILMFGGGLFMILQNAQVTSSLGYGGYFYNIGSFGIPNGLIMLPVIIGIVMLFMLDKKLPGWIVTILGVIFILFTILMHTRLVWRTTSAYVFIIMFGLVAAGGGLMLRVLLRSKN